MTAPVRPSPAEELAALHSAMTPWAQAELIGMARDMAASGQRSVADTCAWWRI
jgi:hypothetical protein